MILLDTSLWVDHLRGSNSAIRERLAAGEVIGHTWVAGELALGGVSAEVLTLLAQLPQARIAEPAELLRFIEDAHLAQTGIGWVDAQLLASARLTPGARLVTADRRLRGQAERLGVAATL